MKPTLFLPQRIVIRVSPRRTTVIQAITVAAKNLLKNKSVLKK